MIEQVSFKKHTEDSTYVNLPYKQPERQKPYNYLIRDRKVLTNPTPLHYKRPEEIRDTSARMQHKKGRLQQLQPNKNNKNKNNTS